MGNVPTNLDAALAKTLQETTGWAVAGGLPFSLASLFNGLTVSSVGHLIPAFGVAPAVGSFNTNWGTTTAVSVAGTDMAGTVAFSTGTASAISADTALFVVTLANAYSSAGYNIMVSFVQASGTPSASAFYAVPTSASTFTVYNTVGFTPASTTAYKFQFVTIGTTATF